MKILTGSYYGATISDWAFAFGIAVVASVGFLLIQRVFISRLRRYAQRTATPLDDIAAEVFADTNPFFVLVVAMYFGSLALNLRPIAAHALHVAAVIAVLLQVAFWANRFVGLWLSTYTQQRRDSDGASVMTASLLAFAARIVLWSLVLVLVLDNLGFSVTTLIASLGVGGIAVALAVQNILGDMFASLSIAIDKPFVIGDFITVDQHMGTVEHIGLKTTRVRSLSGEQIIFSNTDLLKSRIRNYKRMYERRVTFNFGVVYQTRADQLRQIPGIVRDIILAQSPVRFDRAHFKGYGDSSLDFEAVYYVLDSDYNRYMDIQQAINLALFTRFEEEGLEFAYPTRTIFLAREAQSEVASPAAA